MFPRFTLSGLCVAVLLMPWMAHAETTYCVDTVGEFQAALDQAETDLDDSLIMVRAGSFAPDVPLTYLPTLEYVLPAGKLTIRGGYNVGCSSYSLTPGATTLQGVNRAGLVISTSTTDASVAGITLVASPLRMTSPVLSLCPAQRRSFAVRRVRVEQSMLEVTAWCHNVVIENSLFSNGVAVAGTNYPADTALGLYLAYDDDTYESPSSLTMTNSTVSNGRTVFVSMPDDAGTAVLFNNIFDRPAGQDIQSDAMILAVNNRYDGINFDNSGLLLPTSTGNTAAAPGLDASYTPTFGSPMLDSGTAMVPNGLPDTDHAGAARVIGAGVDRGAMESPIDGSGVFVVTNTASSGNGSLAQAVANANATAGSNTIRFNIPGTCPHRIFTSGALQVSDALLIDGWSQPGAVKNTQAVGWNAVPCVVLSGAGGIGIEAMAPLGDAGMTVRGLAFEGYDLAIALAFGAGHTIHGNQFGGRVGNAFTPLSGNMQAIGLIGGGRSTVGGSSLAARNLIGDSSDVGVLITTFLGLGGNDNRVINNLIGLDKNVDNPLPNGTGIRINGGANRVLGNRIGGNLVDGIVLAGEQARDNVIENNDIGGGVSAVGFADAGNGRMGVMLQGGAHDNSIGPDNRIGRNGDDGVRVMNDAGGHNRIFGNQIARNAARGIDLRDNGVDANDPDPVVCLGEQGCPGNRGQNFPLLSTARWRTSGMHPVDHPIEVSGTLRSTVGGPYRIEAYRSDGCDGSAHGEGQQPVAARFITIDNAPYCPGGPGIPCHACTDGNCTSAWTLWLPQAQVDLGDTITVTATSPAGDTSEFSACLAVTLELDSDLIFANGFD